MCSRLARFLRPAALFGKTRFSIPIRSLSLDAKDAKDVKVNPMDFMKIATSFWIPFAIHTASDLKLGELLREGPKTAQYLALQSKTNEEALFRLLRALSSVGFYRQTADGSWENTPYSEYAIAARDMLLHSTKLIIPSFFELTDCIRTGKQVFPKVNNGLTVWEYLDKNPEAQKSFNGAMAATTARLLPVIVAGFPWEKFDGKTIVDIGGNYGPLLCGILTKCSRSHGILFDLPAIKPSADEYLPKHSMQNRIKFIGGSFFDSVPQGDVLVMKSILHDWDDEKSIQILKQCKKSVAKDGTLVIVEMALAEKEPPQYIEAYADLIMMVNLDGKERTVSQWKDLFRQGGFELSKVTRLSPTPFTVIEAKPL